MGTLTYSHTLVAGTTENINDVQDMFNDAKTLLNGNLDGINAPALASPYRTVAILTGGTNGMGANTYIHTGIGFAASPASSASMTAVGGLVNSTAWALTGLTAKLRIRAVMGCNATAPGVNFTFGLYPLTVAGGAGLLTLTTGVVTAGSTVAINTPGASAFTAGSGSDFSLPADGYYALGVAVSGAQAANSVVMMNCVLELRWV